MQNCQEIAKLMKLPAVVKPDSGSAVRNTANGFTLIEVMIVLVIVAIGVALALPSWQAFFEKRKLVSIAEDVASFLATAPSEAVKRNEQVTLSWHADGGHGSDFCMGISSAPKAMPCDCEVTDPAATDYCSVGASADDATDGVDYRLAKTDFVDVSDDIMHMRDTDDSITFDPVRGIPIIANTHTNYDEVKNESWLFYIHSHSKPDGSNRLYGIQMHMSFSGRFKLCSQGWRASRAGGYPRC
jgi:prepilin-type N-terminal cleavage/methylation domain-containing protein